MDYLKSKKIKVKSLDEEVPAGEGDEEPAEGGQDVDGFYDEEEDEDFVVEGEDHRSSDSGEGEMVDEGEDEPEGKHRKKKKKHAK